MKYMGSKRAMLTNGLGILLDEVLPTRQRFVDIFCGSGVVAAHVAQRAAIPVLASDLQNYAVTLTAALIERTKELDTDAAWATWISNATAWLRRDKPTINAFKTLGEPKNQSSLVSWVNECRNRSTNASSRYPITRAYGGYYFSPHQSLAIDALRQTLPSNEQQTFLAALIAGSSSCAAAPGHTAQPFSTTTTSLPHLLSAWRKDVFRETGVALAKLAKAKSKIQGKAHQADAFSVTENLKQSDLVFVDPPYSEVQYSRFYHVLEAISLGNISMVSGTGRYPPIAERPQSNFCLKSKAVFEFDNLMMGIAAQNAEAIVTFPGGDASNGLSGAVVEELSRQYFHVKTREVKSVFSTLGGNRTNRNARMGTTELILHLVPL